MTRVRPPATHRDARAPPAPLETTPGPAGPGAGPWNPTEPPAARPAPRKAAVASPRATKGRSHPSARRRRGEPSRSRSAAGERSARGGPPGQGRRPRSRPLPRPSPPSPPSGLFCLVSPIRPLFLKRLAVFSRSPGGDRQLAKTGPRPHGRARGRPRPLRLPKRNHGSPGGRDLPAFAPHTLAAARPRPRPRPRRGQIRGVLGARCPRRYPAAASSRGKGPGALWGLFHRGTDPIPSARPPKDPPRTAPHLGSGETYVSGANPNTQPTARRLGFAHFPGAPRSLPSYRFPVTNPLAFRATGPRYQVIF